MDPAVTVADAPVKGRTIKLGGFELPVPAWCVPAFGLIAVLYVGDSLLSQPVQTVYSRYLLGKAEEQDQLESYKHFAEQPAAAVHETGAGGTLEAKLFRDGCVSVAWQSALSAEAPHPHFVKQVTAQEATAPRAQSRNGTAGDDRSRGLLMGLFSRSSADGLPWLEQTVAAATESAPAGQVSRHAAGAGCLDPHPGTYSTSYGSRNGCWVQVWRQFSDGCQHYQWFNSCANVWDVNGDGSPRVMWTQCRH